MHARSFFAAGLLGLAALPALAQAPFNTTRLDSLLDQLATHRKLMGSLTLTHDGQPVYTHAFGAARLSPATPATAATRYRVGSISKVFTATMIFQLIEEKKLTLATPLATFFPQLPNAKSITIDQLLSHRSGLHSFTSDADYTQYMTRPKTQAEMLALMAAPKPDFEPGAKYDYSNTNYVLLGYIVEKLTRQTYAQALQKRITSKLGLASTYYGAAIAPQPLEALSYEPTADGWRPSPETDMSIPGGAGAVVSTPTDLARFLEALFGGKLVSAASLATMQTIRDGYGRGLMEVPFGAKRGYGHTGGIDAFRSSAFYWPADQLAVALTTNGGSYSPNEVVVAAMKSYFHQPYRLPDLRPSTYVPAATDLARYGGTYAAPGAPMKIVMTPEGSTLRTQATGQGSFLLEPVSAGTFKFDPAGVRIEFDPTQPTFTLRQGGEAHVFTKE